MTDDELLVFGKQMCELVYPQRYGGGGKPTLSAFSIQLDEAESSDQVVQHAREVRREQIYRCSQRAAQKIAARLKSGPKKPPTVAVLAELIAVEFEELNR